MSSTVVYEIAHYRQRKAGPILLERLQLIAESGSLRLRDGDGNETMCKENDVALAIGSNPVLCKVPKDQQAHITCGNDLWGQLPALLEPIPDGASLFVNGKAWDAFPEVHGNYVMLPGRCDFDYLPEMNPCWAEYRCAEGGRSFENQLVGYSSIGLLAPGIAIEHGRTDYGGNGGKAGVSITPFDDFATTFVDWLLRAPILSSFWQGDRDITTPDVDLFAEAATVADHLGYWQDDDTDDDDDEHDEHDEHDDTEDDTEDTDYEDDDLEDFGSFASRSLELHLPQELIDQVRLRLSE